MKIKHRLNLDKYLIKDNFLEQISTDIEKYYCWSSKIEQGRIYFRNNEKFNIIRRPTFNIKTGIIQLNSNSSSPNLYCETEFPIQSIWFSIGLIFSGLTVGILSVQMPLTVIMVFTVGFSILNFLTFRWIFKHSINRTIKRIKTVQNNGEHAGPR